MFRADAKEIISLAAVHREDPLTTNQSLTFNDTGGSGRTFNYLGVSGASVYNSEASFDITLAWGSNDGSTAAADTDDSLDTLKDSFVASDVTLDAANNEHTSTGAKQWTGANTTLRELAYIREFEDSGGTERDVLLDRAVVPDTTVNTNDTVTITYEWTWSDA